MIARGSGQKLRGMKWNGRRPGLILCDDMEEDEQVENKDRREKFSRWVMRALMPLGRRGCKIRWHGTILHVDAMLSRIMKSSSWTSKLYKAHKGFDDFGDILWPAMWSEERLKLKRQEYIDQGDASGYSQEYLNNPLDSDDAYLRAEWFLPMSDEDWDTSKLICAAADFAISKKDKANRTSVTIGGMNVENKLNFLDQRVGRWDSLEIIEEMFDVHKQWSPDVFFVEDGQIWLSLWPMIVKEMNKRGTFINFVPKKPIRDKASRGRSLQRRMRAGATLWPHDAHWFPGMQDEMLRFTGNSEAMLDDQFDSAALLSLGFEDLADVDVEDFEDEDLQYLRREDPRLNQGRNAITGY
jgi:predicted phage terminase large subunit-like protein